jgi:hypothetical protein
MMSAVWCEAGMLLVLQPVLCCADSVVDVNAGLQQCCKLSSMEQCVAVSL